MAGTSRSGTGVGNRYTCALLSISTIILLALTAVHTGQLKDTVYVTAYRNTNHTGVSSPTNPGLAAVLPTSVDPAPGPAQVHDEVAATLVATASIAPNAEDMRSPNRPEPASVLPASVIPSPGPASVHDDHDGVAASLVATTSIAPNAEDAEHYHKHGFVYVREAFPPSVIDDWAAKIQSYVRNHGKLSHPFAQGAVIPDFMKDPFLSGIFEAVHTSQRLHAVLARIFGDVMGNGPRQYRFLSHNDIGVNVKSTWHKDRLSGIYRGYERHSPWDVVDGEIMRVVKVGLYLEDHSQPRDHSALRVVRSSHTVPLIPKDKRNISFLHPAKGDIIVFDQRITHGGQGPLSKDDHVFAEEASTTGAGEMLTTPSGRRILLQIGYGWNNVHSDDFEMGTKMRQDIFQSPVCSYNGYSSCALKLVQDDFKRRGIHYRCNDAAVCP